MNFLKINNGNPFNIEDINDFKAKEGDKLFEAIIEAHKDIWKEKKRVPRDTELLEKMYISSFNTITYIAAMYHLHCGREEEYERLRTCGAEAEDLVMLVDDIFDIEEFLEIGQLMYYVDTPLFAYMEYANPAQDFLLEI